MHDTVVVHFVRVYISVYLMVLTDTTKREDGSSQFARFCSYIPALGERDGGGEGG